MKNIMIDVLLDRIIILMIAIILSLNIFTSSEVVIATLITIITYCVVEFFNKREITYTAFYLMLLLACFYPPMLLFTPTHAYSFYKNEVMNLITLIILLLVRSDSLSAHELAVFIFIMLLSLLLKYKFCKIQEFKLKYTTTRDDLTETSLQLENRLANTMSEQDAGIRIAMLDERNRIAREIHDNVGHLLSSSILQLGAIMVTEQNELNKELLGNLKTTLDESMNSIRNSVHNIRDESIDLYEALHKMIEDFNKSGKVTAALHYDMETIPDIKEKYAMISIVKEALTNVVKHSDATSVDIRLNEHPGLRQLIISDNGTTSRGRDLSKTSGMGLENIKQRADSLGGIMNINTDKGFRIFISFTK